MADWRGFWSYVHIDDQAEGGRISQLAQDLRSQFEMLTGETLSLFLDKDSLDWGDDWREAIDSNLASIAFFVLVMTPRYFKSTECRREFEHFSRRATKLGIEELILPLYYVDVPAINDQSEDDNFIDLAKKYQWEDWRDIRFLDLSSEGYRRGVARLAKRLVVANRKAEEKAIEVMHSLESEDNSFDQEESLGTLDQLALFEGAFLKIVVTLEGMTQDIERVGQIMKTATDDINRGNSQGQGYSARLAVAHRVASQLEEPAENIWSQSNEYVSQLHNIDDGIRFIVAQVPMTIQEDPENEKIFCGFFKAIRTFSAAAQDGFRSSQMMIDAIEPLEKISRDIRPVLRRLKQGYTIIVESKEMVDEWIQLMDATEVKCEGADF